MDVFAPWHIAILAVVLVVLFGSRRLPDAARSLGRSMRIFKSELRSMHDDDPGNGPRAELPPVKSDEAAPTTPSATAPPPAQSSAERN
jgi:sec-independent protein translocase protein TatA